MLDQIGRLLRQLLCVQGGAGLAFQDDGREPRNVSNGSTMGRFFPGIHSYCFAVLFFCMTHISLQEEEDKEKWDETEEAEDEGEEEEDGK